MAFLTADRPLARVAAPAEAKHGAGFTALRIGRELLGDEADPFFSLDHFRMGTPTFPPHAHAGFSAVTYVLPESAGTMRNRDGHGGLHRIPPGGLHWTAAGAGLMHEEVPAAVDATVEGMQIFVRQPGADEVSAPRVYHVEPGAVPVIALAGGGSARVLAGRYEAQAAPFDAPSPLMLIDVTLPVEGAFRWPDTTPHAAPAQPSDAGFAIYLFAGEIDLGESQGDDRIAVAPAVLVFAGGEGEMQLHARTPARLLVMAG